MATTHSCYIHLRAQQIIFSYRKTETQKEISKMFDNVFGGRKVNLHLRKKKRKQTNSFEVKVKTTSLKGNQKLLSIKTWKEKVSPNYICKYWLSVEISLFADLSRGTFTVIFQLLKALILNLFILDSIEMDLFVTCYKRFCK